MYQRYCQYGHLCQQSPQPMLRIRLGEVDAAKVETVASGRARARFSRSPAPVAVASKTDKQNGSSIENINHG